MVSAVRSRQGIAPPGQADAIATRG